MALNILKNIFGDKSAKDRKEYQPSIDATNQAQEQFKSLSDDELRGKTKSFQEQIKSGIADLENELNSLKVKANDPKTPIHEKEDIFEEIDKLSKTIDEKIEEILEVIRPEAFAVVKETARRWAQNGKLEVTTQEFDRDLAAKKDGITIEGEKAIWHNTWTAAGAEVAWNMVHYDV